MDRAGFGAAAGAQKTPSPALSRTIRLLGSLAETKTMLYTIALVLIILWLLGLVTGTTMSGFIHVLLVIAVIMVLLRLISGRKPL